MWHLTTQSPHVHQTEPSDDVSRSFGPLVRGGVESSVFGSNRLDSHLNEHDCRAAIPYRVVPHSEPPSWWPFSTTFPGLRPEKCWSLLGSPAAVAMFSLSKHNISLALLQVVVLLTCETSQQMLQSTNTLVDICISPTL